MRTTTRRIDGMFDRMLSLGASDLMVEVFGERGRHTRASVGMSSLPGNIPVEISMIVEIEE